MASEEISLIFANGVAGVLVIDRFIKPSVEEPSEPIKQHTKSVAKDK